MFVSVSKIIILYYIIDHLCVFMCPASLLCLCFSVMYRSLSLSLWSQVGHRDFDVEKRLRRDLKRTHALLSDAQLLLSTVEQPGQGHDPGAKEQLERLCCQVPLPSHHPHSTTHTIYTASHYRSSKVPPLTPYCSKI